MKKYVIAITVITVVVIAFTLAFCGGNQTPVPEGQDAWRNLRHRFSAFGRIQSVLRDRGHFFYGADYDFCQLCGLCVD